MNLLDLFVKIGVEDNASSKVESLSTKFKTGLASAGKIAAAGVGLVTAAAGAAGGALLALESATEEYRVAQGKLNTAFEAAGYSTETAQEAYRGFYEILGDTDTATEASQLLAKLAQSEEDVAKWTEIAAGVNGTFGDSLPIEGLIEAANETAKVGTVTGTLADALNWAGISEDAFNAKLAAAGSESERNQLIMETLAGTYDEASGAFYRNNESIVAARNSQIMMDKALATLGQTVSDVKNRLMSEFVPALANVATAFSGVLTGAEGADEQFAIAVGELVNTAVSKLPEFLGMGVQIITALVSGIVQSIPTVVAAVPQIVTQIGTALSELFPEVLDMGVQLLDQFVAGIETGLPDMVSRLPQIIEEFLTFITDSLPEVLDKGVEMLNSLVDGIIDSIPVMVSNLPKIITAFTEFISENLPKIVAAGISIIANLVVGLIGAIPEIVSALPEIMNAIIDGFYELMDGVADIGVDIVEGIWGGIESMAGWIGDKVSGFFGGLIDGAKNLLGIHSPSTVFADMGKNMAMGLGEGWDSQYGQIKRQIEGGMDFGVATVDFASSGLGVSSAGIINSVASGAKQGDSQYAFNLVLPDGSVLASYVFNPLVDYSKANGTPILNPT